MRSQIVTIGLLLLVVGAGLGVTWINNSSLSQNLIAYGTPVAKEGVSGPPFYIPFYYPTNSTQTISLSYLYGDAKTSVYLLACENLTTASCSIDINQVSSVPIKTDSGATTITGASGTGTYTLAMGPLHWYIAVTNEPLVVVAKIQPTLLSEAIEGSSLGLLVGGFVISVLGFRMEDPLRRPTPRLAQLKRTLYFFFQNRLAVAGLAILVFFILLAILSPMLAPTAPTYYGGTGQNSAFGTDTTNPVYCVLTTSSFSPNGSFTSPNACANNLVVQVVCATQSGQCTLGGSTIVPGSQAFETILGPTWIFPFNLGPLPMGSIYIQAGGAGVFLNIYESMVRATPWDLLLSGVIVTAGALIGIVLGALAGYVGGYLDEIIMRVTDIFLAIPQLLLTIIILVAFIESHPGFSTYQILELLILSFVIVWWPGYTRLVRGQVLVTREQKYVEAAKASGAGTARIVARHIIPNSVYPVFVQMSLDVGSVPLLFGVLAYLGFDQEIGFQTSFSVTLFPEWGSLSALGVNAESLASIITAVNPPPFPWWQVLFPGLALFLFAIAVNFLADGLRDALDPRLRR